MRSNIVLVLLMLLAACTSVKPFTNEDAVAIAQQFVEDRVRFFASETINGSTENIPAADISIIRVYPEADGMWTVLLYVEGLADNVTKRGGLAIAIDPEKREVIDAQPFNARANESDKAPQLIRSDSEVLPQD